MCSGKNEKTSSARNSICSGGDRSAMAAKYCSEDWVLRLSNGSVLSPSADETPTS